MTPCTFSSSDCCPIATRSAPDEKLPPAPVRMAHRTSGVSSMYSYPSTRPASMSPERAFFFSGRFMVRITTGPSRSTVQCLVVMSRISVTAGRVEHVPAIVRRPAEGPDGGPERQRKMGFWKYAQEDPGYVAIVDPDGTEHAAGDVLA